MPVNKVFDTAMVMLTKFQQKFPGHGPKLKQSPARWKPPTTGELKANFDGAVFVNTGEAGIGVVIRNEFGEVMAALSEKIAFPSSVETLELLAARRAAVFVVELGLQQISFKGVAEGVIKALSQRDVTHSSVGHIVKDFRSIASSLGTFSLSHTRRQGNNVAHALARRALFFFPLLVWVENVPPNILQFVLDDFPS
ncbi:uncharacterized protein LOC126705266 [Quercus robur]|uniref:uncharacterized protein LOC126705266 n=1 Tax=Quercus robur TaxID=38942 RepID=UPI002163AA36|nr:uncharacterized protein LOC126705266 [Quercus robur]